MIDEDIRHIIEPELAEGEELLWAETISHSKIRDAVNVHEEDGQMFLKIGKFLAPLFIISAVLFPSFRIIGLFLALLVGLGMYNNYRVCMRKAQGTRELDIGGYAISNVHFFKLARDLSVLEKLDAKLIKKVREGSDCVVVAPIGKGIFDHRHLRYLSNNYATANYLKSMLKTTKPFNNIYIPKGSIPHE